MFRHRMSKAGSTKTFQDKATHSKGFLLGVASSTSRSTSKCSKITLRRSRFRRTSPAGPEGSTWLIWEGSSWLWRWNGVWMVTCRKQLQERWEEGWNVEEAWRMLSAQDDGFGKRGPCIFLFTWCNASRQVVDLQKATAIFKVKYKDRDAQTPSVFTKRTYETFRMNEPPGRPWSYFPPLQRNPELIEPGSSLERGNPSTSRMREYSPLESARKKWILACEKR